jgi:hypothetical protein
MVGLVSGDADAADDQTRLYSQQHATENQGVCRNRPWLHRGIG